MSRGAAPLRVGIAGARRVRQGLGPFVARRLVEAGAVVPAVLGTSPESAAAACAELERGAGLRARGFTSLGALLASEPLDALAILTPHPSHAGYLEQALAHGLHVLCEKPLVWGEERPGARARALTERFGAAGLLLVENCQWPHVLPAYAALHPGSLETPPKRFRMRLSPLSETPLAMLVDCLHHPLSLLQQLLPGEDGAVEAPVFAFRARGAAPGAEPLLELRFGYRRGGRRVDVELALEHRGPGPGSGAVGAPGQALPREAGLGWDGHWADRFIRPPDYSIYLAAGERSVQVPDPLGRLVEWFVGELGAQREGRCDPAVHRAVRRDIALRMEALEALFRSGQAEGLP